MISCIMLQFRVTGSIEGKRAEGNSDISIYLVCAHCGRTKWAKAHQGFRRERHLISHGRYIQLSWHSMLRRRYC